MNVNPWDRLFSTLGEISYLIIVGGLGWKGSLSEHSTMSLLFAFAFAKFGSNLYRQNVAHSLSRGDGGGGGGGSGDSTRRMEAVVPPAARGPESPGRYRQTLRRVTEWFATPAVSFFTWVWFAASLFVIVLMLR